MAGDGGGGKTVNKDKGSREWYETEREEKKESELLVICKNEHIVIKQREVGKSVRGRGRRVGRGGSHPVNRSKTTSDRSFIKSSQTNLHTCTMRQKFVYYTVSVDSQSVEGATCCINRLRDPRLCS